MAHGGGDARFLLQSRSVLGFAAEILAQQLERDETIQERVTRLIHRAHPANAKRLQHHEMIERSFHPNLLAAFWAGDSHQRFCIARVDCHATGRACLYHCELPSSAIANDCNIRKSPSNEKAAAN